MARLRRGSGYRGRTGVFEVIRITPELAEMVQARRPLPEVRAAVRRRGVWLLQDSALDKARRGLTSLETALSVSLAEVE